MKQNSGSSSYQTLPECDRLNPFLYTLPGSYSAYRSETHALQQLLTATKANEDATSLSEDLRAHPWL